MATIIFANNAKTLLAAALTSTATTASVTPGTGSLFPSPAANQYFVLTLTDAATGLINEIVWVTAVSGDTLTIVRGQEGTTALSWLIGDYASCFPTAGTLADVIQPDQLQSGTYGYSVATGTANALTATVGSRLTALPDGMPITIKAAAANTSTVSLVLTLGSTVLGSHPIVKGNNSPLIAGDIPAAGYVMQLNWSATFNSYLMQNPATGVSTIPPGSIFMFPCSAANVPAGFLIAEGQLLSRTTYAALYAFAAASGNIVSDSTWTGSGQYGSFSTGNGTTTFRLPQYGGYFLRPLDNGNGVDPSRAIGTTQAGAIVSHTHGASSTSYSSTSVTLYDPGHVHTEGLNLAGGGFNGGGSYVGSGGNQFSGSGSSNFGFNGAAYPTNAAVTGLSAGASTSTSTNTSIGNTGGSETRPINISVLTCIKY